MALEIASEGKGKIVSGEEEKLFYSNSLLLTKFSE